MGREFELKYAANADVLEALKKRYDNFRAISMETAYYDTPDRKLSERHCTLRRRMENKISVCTYKCPHKDGGRGEWEVEAVSIEEGVTRLCEAGANKELLFAAATGLVEVCGARFTRLAAPLEVPGAAVELALDQGVLIGNGKELPFAEVEVELKEGTDEAAIAFAQELAAEFGLVPEGKSKFARAMALAME